MRYYIRPMTSVDLSNVLHIQASVYHADLLEGIEFFQNRLLLSAANCWVAEGEASLLGYLISYPWLRTFPPELDVMLENIPPDADSWFVKVGNVKRPLSALVKLTDTGFWKVFDFSFILFTPAFRQSPA